MPATQLDTIKDAPCGEIAANPLDPALASPAFIQFVPLDFARDRLVMSQGATDDGREVLVTSGRDDDDLIAHNISVRLGRPISMHAAPAETLAAALDGLAQRIMAQTRSNEGKGNAAQNADAAEFGTVDERDVQAVLKADERDLLQTAGRAPVVRLVNGLLFEALQRRASDVHVQALQETTTIRYRVDGVLFEGRSLPRKLLEPIVSRIKVMAQMDIAERRIPQDGRTAVRIGEKEIDLRVSSIPTALGERLVIRLLDKRDIEMFTLARLGMPADIRARFESICDRPHGMVLVTGPTGSGKTTTLYAALRRMDCAELNIMTLEDPVEYELPGVSQSQVNTKKGVTFATGLRHVLRQDPDVIMVGEVRDAETARVAIQAALTGHLVFSTLHTNSAASAVTRLLDLGVEPYLLNASLSAVLAQRLVRLSCRTCGGTGEITAEKCSQCLGSGYKSRMGLFELLVVDEAIRKLVHAGASASEVHAAARRGWGLAPSAVQMRSLREAGLAAVSAGLTSREEVDRVVLLDDGDEEIVVPPPAGQDIPPEQSI